MLLLLPSGRAGRDFLPVQLNTMPQGASWRGRHAPVPWQGWRRADVRAQEHAGHAPLRAGRWAALKENAEGTGPSILSIAYVILLPGGRSEWGWAQVEGVLRKTLPGNVRFPLVLEVSCLPLCHSVPREADVYGLKLLCPLTLWLHFGPQDKEVSSHWPVPL